ncbi:MAG TPA: tetratricopeptide repeat protein [Candidatus Acidoferrum sp.]
MAGLAHFFYPWGLILQGLAIWHFIRRRPETYWLWIIIIGGVLGAGVYILAEVIPDLGLLRGTFQGFSRKSRIKQLEMQILDNPSAGNLEELADLYFDNKDYANAREALNRAIAARSDSPHSFYLRAKSALALEDYAAAIPDLELVVAKDQKFDYYRAVGLLADAYARTGDLDRAAQCFALAIEHSSTPETLFNYANFLRLSGKKDEAREWAAKLAAKKRTLPRYMQRVERPCFRRGKALQKQLTA